MLASETMVKADKIKFSIPTFNEYKFHFKFRRVGQTDSETDRTTVDVWYTRMIDFLGININPLR